MCKISDVSWSHQAKTEKSKAKISLKQAFKSLEFEHKMLKKLNHKLICNLYYAFQDTENLYMIMDLI